MTGREYVNGSARDEPGHRASDFAGRSRSIPWTAEAPHARALARRMDLLVLWAGQPQRVRSTLSPLWRTVGLSGETAMTEPGLQLSTTPWVTVPTLRPACASAALAR